MEGSTEKSIDEQLAQANKQFDERLKAEKSAKKVEAGVRVSPKPEKARKAKPGRKRHLPGEVAHQHWNETETEVIERDCLYVEHTVRDRKGFAINDMRYRGKVVVPQCVANYLSMMENRHQQMERGVFEDRGRTVGLGELRG